MVTSSSFSITYKCLRILHTSGLKRYKNGAKKHFYSSKGAFFNAPPDIEGGSKVTERNIFFSNGKPYIFFDISNNNNRTSSLEGYSRSKNIEKRPPM